MNKRNTLLIQILGELAIPLMGFFLWNWSLYFILLFYIIENLFATYFQVETFRKFQALIQKKSIPLDVKQLFIFLGFWLLEVIFIHVFLFLTNPSIQFGKEIIDFFMYEDMGIPQGFLLIPLLYFASTMKMKQDIRTLIISITSIDEVNKIKPTFTYFIAAFIFWIFLSALAFLISIPQTLIISMLLILFLYRTVYRSKLLM